MRYHLITISVIGNNNRKTSIALNLKQYCLKKETLINIAILTSIMSTFIDFMGNSPKVRVIDYLLTERDLDFSITDLAHNSNISRATLYRIWNSLIKYNIIVHTRIIGKAKLFKLNKNNNVIKKLIEIDEMLTEKELKLKTIIKATKT